MNLNALQDFIDIAEKGGYGAASRLSGTPKATLSRRIRLLEDTLSIRLFERDSTGFRLTEEGAQLYERTAPLLQEITDIKNDILHHSNTGSGGTLRISVPTVVAHHITGPLAEIYHARYPQIELDIVADDKRIDPIKDGFDAVIRVNPAIDEEMVGRVLFTAKLYLVIAPGAEDGAETLSFIGSERDRLNSLLQVTCDGTNKSYQLHTVMRLSSPQMRRQAAIRGAGVALLPDFLVTGDIQGGKLQLLGISNQPDIEFWFLYPSRRYVTPRLRNLLAILHDLCEQDRLMNTRPGHGEFA